jgi:hypothetical protein
VVSFEGMEIHANPHKFTKIYDNQLKSTKICQNPQKSTKIHKNPQKSAKICSNPQKSTKIHKNLPKSNLKVGRLIHLPFYIRSFVDKTHLIYLPICGHGFWQISADFLTRNFYAHCLLIKDSDRRLLNSGRIHNTVFIHNLGISRIS